MPVIGIPIPVEQATWREWGGPAYLLSTAYVRQLSQVGASPVFLPDGGDDAQAALVMSRLDGLILPGGADIDPALYQAEPHPLAGPFDRSRDAWECALARQAMALDIPILGICRGMHLLNVILGGTLVQHLPDRTGNDIHNPTRGRFGVHRVSLAPGSRIATALGPTAEISTYHHQAVDVVSPRLTPVAWADDGTVEALEDTAGRILAVQWHPEAAESPTLFRHFIEEYARPGFSGAGNSPAEPTAGFLRAQASVAPARKE